MSDFLLGNAPLPMTDAISMPKRRDQFGPKQNDPLEGLLSPPWADYLSRMAQTVGAAATRISSVSLTSQLASVSPTDISGGTLKEGLYRISYHLRITTPDGISSDLTVTLDWTDGGVAQSEVSKTVSTNTTDTRLHGDFLIHIDASTPVRYSTTIVTGLGDLEYRLDVVLEVIKA